jgi:uncharacterized membrane protein YkvA (DUF1232 family)
MQQALEFVLRDSRGSLHDPKGIAMRVAHDCSPHLLAGKDNPAGYIRRAVQREVARARANERKYSLRELDNVSQGWADEPQGDPTRPRRRRDGHSAKRTSIEELAAAIGICDALFDERDHAILERKLAGDNAAIIAARVGMTHGAVRNRWSELMDLYITPFTVTMVENLDAHGDLASSFTSFIERGECHLRGYGSLLDGHAARFRRRSPRTTTRAVRLARALDDAAQRLVTERRRGIDQQYRKRMLVAAIAYFIADDDARPDAGPDGLRDDAVVARVVLRWLGFRDLAAKLNSLVRQHQGTGPL